MRKTRSRESGVWSQEKGVAAWARRRRAAYLRAVFPGGRPISGAVGPLALASLPQGVKWISGAGAVPLAENTSVGIAWMRRLDAKNLPHQTVFSTKTYLVWSGEVRLRVGGRTHRLRRGDLLMVPPGVVQQVRSIRPGTRLLLIRTPDAGNTKLDKLDEEGRPFPI